MTADEIRKMQVPQREYGNPVSEVQEFALQLAREFVAQLAELNSNLRVHTAVSEGGDPRGY